VYIWIMKECDKILYRRFIVCVAEYFSFLLNYNTKYRFYGVNK